MFEGGGIESVFIRDYGNVEYRSLQTRNLYTCSSQEQNWDIRLLKVRIFLQINTEGLLILFTHGVMSCCTEHV